MKTTKKAKILKLLADRLTPKEVAAKMKIPVGYVYTTRHNENKSVKGAAPKRVGRPAWENPRPANILQKESQLLAKTLLEDKVESLNIEIANLKHQIIGFRAVISYLENLAGVKDSQ